jgi:ADP-ribose pyrophosphatase YjhB (NUDIX family)
MVDPKIKSVYWAYDPQAQPTRLDAPDSGSQSEAFRYCPACRSELAQRDIGGLARLACPNCDFVRYRNPRPTLSVLAVRDGRVVLGVRKAQPGAGKWALPSGYIEFDEDFLSAARREFRDETGLEVEIRSVLHVASSFLTPEDHFFYMYLEAAVTGGELHHGDDLAEVAWFALDGPLPDLAFQEDADVLEAYRRNELNRLRVQP